MRLITQLGRIGKERKLKFRYRRKSTGVYLGEYEEGRYLVPPCIFLTNAEWSTLLRAIENAPEPLFDLVNDPNSSGESKNDSLYDLVKKTIPRPLDLFEWTEERQAGVCAILESEGTVRVVDGDRCADLMSIQVSR